MKAFLRCFYWNATAGITLGIGCILLCCITGLALTSPPRNWMDWYVLSLFAVNAGLFLGFGCGMAHTTYRMYRRVEPYIGHFGYPVVLRIVRNVGSCHMAGIVMASSDASGRS